MHIPIIVKTSPSFLHCKFIKKRRIRQPLV
ncbi:hypothetical protein CSPAE12_03987 [Colletotrichum incanum]|nr:hypothetical protein CSPAE12_03987 [Colletotrichum incanum]